MPVYLPPISRRRLLTQTALAGAGLMLRSSLRAFETTEDTASWVFLSDTHIAADAAATSRGQNMANNLANAIRDVLALPRRPEGVIINGDLAHNVGNPGDYDRLVEGLRPLREAGLPIVLALGNHDHRETFRGLFPDRMGQPASVTDRHAMLIETPLVNWFVLDSLDRTNVSSGLLGEAQIDWLARELDRHNHRPAIVVVHHHLNPGDDKIALLDTPELLEVIRPRRQVKAYVYGHRHAWSVTNDPSGVHLIGLPPTSYLFAPGHPIGWLGTTIKRDGIRLELYSLDRSHPAHRQVVDLRWRTEV